MGLHSWGVGIVKVASALDSFHGCKVRFGAMHGDACCVYDFYGDVERIGCTGGVVEDTNDCDLGWPRG